MSTLPLIILTVLLIIAIACTLFLCYWLNKVSQANQHLREQLSDHLTEAIVQKEREQAALRESEERFRATFDQAAVGIAHVAPDGTWLRVNQKLCEIVGYSREELLQTTFQQITHPDDLSADLAYVQQMLAGEISLYTMEKRYIRKDRSLVWIQLTVSLVREQNGDPNYFISVVADITERKRTERELQTINVELEQRVKARTAELTTSNQNLQAEVIERLGSERQLRQTAQQLGTSNRALQDFAYVASHDLQEPLRKVQAFGDRLQAKYSSELGAQGQDYLRRMQNAAKRMQMLIQDLLVYSRLSTQVQPFESVDLNLILREVLSDLEARLEQTTGNVKVGKLPTLLADPIQMRQLFQNLIANALKFHRPGIPPQVTVSHKDIGQAVEIQVQDNGIGFNLKYLDRIFTPFERLHSRSAYEGTGIGLAICRKIVERHSGQITAISSAREGAIFVVTLPYTQSQDDDPI